MDIWKQVQELQKTGIDEILKTPALKSEYVKIYKRIFLTDLCVSCRSIIKNSFKQFLELTKSKINIMADRKYIFKEGTVLWVQSEQKHFTNDNLTDKKAKELLKSNAAYAKFFETMPAADKKSKKTEEAPVEDAPAVEEAPVEEAPAEEEKKPAAKKAAKKN